MTDPKVQPQVDDDELLEEKPTTRETTTETETTTHVEGDTVQVVGTKSGWFEIFPPNGTYCLIIKDAVELDTDGKAATLEETVDAIERTVVALAIDPIQGGIEHLRGRRHRSGGWADVVLHLDLQALRKLSIEPPTYASFVK